MNDAHPTTDQAHVFSHLAPPPYRYAGYEKSLFKAGDTVKAGSSCDHCGAAIADCYWFRGADGRRFKVGSTCVEKSGDKGLYSIVKRAANAVKSKQRRDAGQLKIEAFRAQLGQPSVRVTLAELPHPKARAGSSYLDYADWMLKNAGHAGILRVAREVAKLTEARP